MCEEEERRGSVEFDGSGGILSEDSQTAEDGSRSIVFGKRSNGWQEKRKW